MNEAMRRQIVLSHEGQVLALASNHDAEHAAFIAHCIADGVMNAIIRIEGPDRAAEFAFALGDRVVGRVRASTYWPAAQVAEVTPSAVAAAEPPKVVAKKKSMMFLPWLAGFFSGFIIGAGL
jgi:hypothetical protein